MASVGVTEVTVSVSTTVGIISTGNELVEPDRAPAGAQIRNSSYFATDGTGGTCRCHWQHYGIARDEGESYLLTDEKGIEENDVVLSPAVYRSVISIWCPL